MCGKMVTTNKWQSVWNSKLHEMDEDDLENWKDEIMYLHSISSTFSKLSDQFLKDNISELDSNKIPKWQKFTRSKEFLHVMEFLKDHQEDFILFLQENCQSKFKRTLLHLAKKSTMENISLANWQEYHNNIQQYLDLLIHLVEDLE